MNYKLWTKAQLADKIMSYGDNPYGMTKAQMVEYLQGADEAREMTYEELLAHVMKGSTSMTPEEHADMHWDEPPFGYEDDDFEEEEE